jgi:hypothetical protein
MALIGDTRNPGIDLEDDLKIRGYSMADYPNRRDF